MRWWKSFKYKHLTLLGVGIVIAILLSKVDALTSLLLSLGTFGYIGAFFAGTLFSSAFTVGTSIVVLFALGNILSPWELAMLGGLGAAVADFFIFRFVRNDLAQEIIPIYNRLGGAYITRVLNHKYLRWALPLVGAFIIASPFPDEIGVTLMGFSRIKTHHFLLISFLCNALGIFILISAYLLLKA